MGLKSDFINLLCSPNVTRTDFQLFGQRIRGSDYRHIATAIRNGHIQIIRGSRTAANLAAYNRRLNCITVGPGTPDSSLIVHEATHAINDWHGRSLSSPSDEGLAYVAQMIFVCRLRPDIQRAAQTSDFRQNALGATRTCGVNQRNCNTATIGYATIIAATLINGQAPSAQLLRDYQMALGRDPYVMIDGGNRQYNRINRVEIPQAYLVQVGGQIVND